MALSRRVFVVGGAHTKFTGKGHPDFIWKRHPDFGKRENPTIKQLMQQAVDGCLADTGVDPATVDRLYIGNFVGELFVKQGHLGSALVGTNPAFSGKPAARLEAACASGGLAVMAGIDAIAAGANTVLVAGAEVQTTQSARVGADYLARAADYARQRSIDEFTFPALFAKRIRAAHDAWGLSHDDLGHFALKAYNNANKNPNAHMVAKHVTYDWARAAGDGNPNFLANEEFGPWLKISDCSQVSDGASAMILVSQDGLAALGLTEADAVEVIGRAHVVSSLYEDGDATELTTVKMAIRRAYDSAGVGVDDIDVAEVHDCFTIAELLSYDALGLCKKQDAARVCAEGQTAIDGKLPVNTGGGLVGFGHPVGATGVKQVLELYRQMKGRCGDYQIPTLPKLGVTANMGGDDKTVVSVVVRSGQ